MKRIIFRPLYLGVLFLVTSLSSCFIDEEETTTLFLSDENYAIVSQHLNLPNELPNYSNSEEGNRDYQFDAKALAGRVLFYDKHLSIDNSTACESCHHQELGFADDKDFSEGINGQVTERNSIAFSATGASNSESNPYFGDEGSFGASMFWDHRASNVPDQIRETIENTIEMGMPLDELDDKLNNVDYIKVLMGVAYGAGDVSYTISSDHIVDALLKFMQSLNPSNSKFDQVLNDFSHNGLNSSVVFTNMENMGHDLYMVNCSICHGFTGGMPTFSTMNNGLGFYYGDEGNGSYKFKVPALRNVAVSGPYMHDGRFETLEEVIEHYSSGIVPVQEVPNVMPDFGLPVGGFNFSDTEKEALLQFLHTMTDESFLQDERFSSPF
jgi:cytochrome c peroxidase